MYLSNLKLSILTKKNIVSLFVIIFLLFVTIIIILQPKNTQDIRKKAAEPTTLKKAEGFLPGSIIVKFKKETATPSYSDGKPLDQGPVSITKVNTKELVALKRIGEKFKEVTIEKVFPKIEDPQSELSKVRIKFQKQLDNNEKSIDQVLFLQTDLSRIFRVSFDRQVPVEIVIQEFLQDPEVEYAEPDVKYKTSIAVNDKYFLDPDPRVPEREVDSSSGGWNPKKEDESDLDYQWNLKKIGFPKAWDYLGENKETVVAVIDTGVDYNHEEFQGKIWENEREKGTDEQGKDKKSNNIDDDDNGFIDDWRGWDSIFYGYNCFGFTCANFKFPDNDPMDDWREPYFTGYTKGGGHGTHVAGIIGATANNSLGIAGMNPGAKIMVLRGLTAEGDGYSSQLATLITYAAKNGAKVINMSWGGSSSQTLSNAIDYAYSLGVTLVAAAGNEGNQSVLFPASHPKVIAVGAIDEKDHITTYSSYGSKISVVAPGGGSRNDRNPSSILSLRGEQTDIYCLSDTECINGRIQHTNKVVGQDLKYYRASGTSMAAPHVSGLTSMILSKNLLLTTEQVRTIIEYSSDDLGTLGKDDKYGYGKINTERALKEFSINPPPVALLTEPYDREHLYFGKFEIRGTVSSNQFEEDRIEFAPFADKDNWSSDGITLVGAGINGIQNGLLGTWDSGNLTGKYYLKLTTVDKENRERSFVITIELINGILKKGWPKILPSSGAYNETNHILVADLDDDGKSEIVKANADKVYVYRENGELFNDSWPVTLGSTIYHIAIGHVDGSQKGKQIIATITSGYSGMDQAGIKYISLNGDVKEISSKTIFRGNLADVNGDGIFEIITYESSISGISTIHALDKNGVDVINFPVTYQYPITETYWNSSSIRTGDINGDKMDDIVINSRSASSTDTNRLFAVSGDGKVLWNKDLYVGYGSISPFILADIDNNGQLEVLFYDSHQINQYPWASINLYVYKGDGTNFFSVNPDVTQIGSGRLFIVNTDGGQSSEVMILGGRNYGIVSEKGNLTIANYPSNFDLSYTPLPVDAQTISGLTGTQGISLFGSSQLYVLPKNDWPQITNQFISDFIYKNDNFSLRDGYPKGIIADLWAYDGSGFLSNVAVADTDGNGKSEKIFYYCLKRKNSCYLYNLEHGDGLSRDGWYQYLHDERHTGAYKDVRPPTPTPTPYLNNTPPRIDMKGLIRGYVGKKYKGELKGYDKNKGDKIIFTAINLPEGIIVGECREEEKAVLKYIYCPLTGIPNKEGKYIIKIDLTDDKGGRDKRTFDLEIRK